MNNIPASVLTEHPGKGIGTACLGIACVLIALGWNKVRVWPQERDIKKEVS